MTPGETEAFLDLSCQSTRDLYLFMLSIVKPLTQEALSRIEAARSKFNPTEEEKNPNMKFTRNRIAPLLDSDVDFCKIISRKKLSWTEYDAFLRHLYESVREKDYFRKYLESEGESLKEDAALWEKIFEEEFLDNEELAAILEDLSIYWTDDLGYALSWCCRSIYSLGEGKAWNLPPLYMSEMDKDPSRSSDKVFVTKLLRQACGSFAKYYSMVSESTPKWDKNRICITDLALIVCGLAEADAFKDIPSRVTINEYVEISKYYSTPESRSFVNGLLDKLINKH